MINQEMLSNSNVLPLLPLFYVAWSDAILTSKEIDDIKELLDEQSWLEPEERLFLYSLLNTEKPPSSLDLKNWLAVISRHSKDLDHCEKQTLAEFGVKLAEKSTVSKIKKVSSTKTFDALKKVEGFLGIISDESYDQVFQKNDQVERTFFTQSPAFEQQQMTALLDGENAKIINKVKGILKKLEFKLSHIPEKEAYREKVLTWCEYLAKEGLGNIAFPEEYGGKGDMGKYFAVMETLSYHDLSMVIKFGVQFGLFGMSVFFLGTKKHHDKYLKDAGTLKLPGCFAMTETGHGSNVQGIETTSTFDRSSNEFIIHTPNLTAGKEYIGNAAVHGQLATVFAQLVIDNVNFGVTAFLVPIRNKEGQVCKGVRIEDCGYKLGLNGVDNGRIWFDQVRIPAEDMLDRFASVNSEGLFESPISSDNARFFTMLGTLVGGRIGIPRASLSASKVALTIAVKYALIRRQFGPAGKEEVPIMHYNMHKRKLMPLLANSYALHFALKYLTQRFLDRTEEDSREIETMAAGLKSFTTWNATATIQTCREACGGKGYLEENRFADLKADTDVFTTFEGDNTVLMQLVAKGRLTEFRHEFSEINVIGIVKYIGSQASTAILELNPVTKRNTDKAHLLDKEFHLAAFEYREKHLLVTAAKRLKAKIDAGLNSFEAANQCQDHMINLAHGYIERLVLDQFIKVIESCKNEAIRKQLNTVCQLFALSQIEKNKGWFLEHDYLEGSKSKAIRRMVTELCNDMSEQSGYLVDSFNIPSSCLAPIILD